MKRETGDDRKREAAVAKVMAEALGARAVAKPEFAIYDYDLIDNDGNLVAIIEVKVRTEDYPSMMISRSKVANLRTVAEGLGVTAMLVWAVMEGDKAEVRYVDVANVDMGRHRVGGRTDRGDMHDVEDCVMVAVDMFKAAGRADL